jgi:hypothetical protein
MSLTRAASSAPIIVADASARTSAVSGSGKSEPKLPPHVETFLGMLKTHFESARDSRQWDQHDTRAYGKVVLKLSGDECRILMDRLRAKHHWRPSVAQVSEALLDILEKTAPERVLSGADVAMRTVHTMPRALPSAANGPHREAARREIARRRVSASLVPEPMRGAGRSPVAERKAPAPAAAPPPASIPASWVGLLVVAAIEGRDYRGVVWSEDGDTLTIKGQNGRFVADKSVIRIETPVSGGAR